MWHTLSNVLDRSMRIKAVIFFWPNDLRMLSVIYVLRVSVEWFCLLPLWWRERILCLWGYSEYCLKTIFSHILENIGSRDIRRLFGASSWSPSFRIGMISASFQASGYTLDNKELFMMLVRGIKIWDNESFIVRAHANFIWTGGFVVG